MTRRHRPVLASGQVVLLVDDDPDYVEATRMLLAAEGHEVLTATNGPAALVLLRQRTVDVLLLDYFMPGMTGEEVVARLREFDTNVQIVLQTGYSEEQPARALLRRLDIHGYYDKGDGPDRLLLWTDAALKASREVSRLRRVAAAHELVAEAALRFHSPRGLGALEALVAESAATLAGTLAGAARGGEELSPAALLTLLDPAGHVLAAAGHGSLARFGPNPERIPHELLTTLRAVTAEGAARTLEEGTVVPVGADANVLGALLVQPRLGRAEHAPLARLAHHAGLALAATHRHRDYALPPTPGLVVLSATLEREVRSAMRLRLPLTVAIIGTETAAAPGEGPPSAAAAELQSSLRVGDAVLGVDRDGHLVAILPATAGRGALRVLRRAITRLPRAAANDAPLRWRAGLASLPTHRWPRPLVRPEPATVQQHAAALYDRARSALLAAEPRAGVPALLAPDL